MEGGITVIEPLTALAQDELVTRAHNFAQQAKAANTRRAYKSDWRDFQSWCQAQNVNALPAEPATVALYITDLAARLKTSTLRRRLVAVSQAHQASGLPSPASHLVVREVLKGVLRQYGSVPTQKSAIGAAELRVLLAKTPDHLMGVRDRAILLVGFAAALRRSELVGLDVGDIAFVHDQGMIIHLRRSKTDAEGRGREVAVPYAKRSETCPVFALQCWLQRSGVSTGPIFRSIAPGNKLRNQRLSDRGIARVVQRHANAAGLDSSRYGGHSLRSGFVTSAAAAGAAEHDIQEVTGHRSVQVLRQYVRHGTIFHKCPLREMDL